ncbi:DUF4105 domain-containing protein [Sulfuricaulis sp.]|jgi:hypothetical protein|uniref:Lnb N-terminal periplasmic domain-containing protein n=1 Tax=Sulfuricaulis sp. TaxID=2003553 RepID=UPI003559A873
MKPPATFFKRFARLAGIVFVGLLLLGIAGWGVLALYYFDHESLALRTGLATAFALASLIAFVGFALPRWRWRVLAVYLVLFAALLSWWSSLAPSNDRDWQPDVAILPYAIIDGDRVTVHNIRNFVYRTETDFTPAYYDKTFDLRKLDGVDLIASYWMGPAIAHIFLSFDFQGGDHLAISIETRKERGEGYSTVKGFFRQYELYYVVADERDVIRLRTNYRKDPPEDVYVYRVNGSAEKGRRVFLQYIEEINALKDRPEWYNTLTTNCTTAIWMHTRINPGHPPLSWKVLASGYVPEYLYEIGRLDSSLPFAALQRRAHVNTRAQAADKAADFSRQIRAGLPGAQLSASP